MRNLTYILKKTLPALVALAAVFALFAPEAKAQVPSYSSPVLQRPTYAAAASFTYPVTGVGDAACLVGSATKTIRVSHVRVSGTDATPQSAVMSLVKRTAANSGGTSTQPSIATYDSSVTAAATAVMNAYTVVPTPGTGIAIRADEVNLLATTTATSVVDYAFNPQDQLNQAITLRGVAQSLCVNFPNALTTNAAALNVTFEWTEQ